ncbi:MarR family winged helix-turn-helix transcriptional regulator [Pontibacter sp. E15-1]|uniref:MarR family winged helix-turn-helix transcriptional regulator n=1 Tax=Pontibacter sp. E15-1 TaxID=2919918 RepID=UPI001FD9C6FF|nr:MarR family transcriptional regulator [Pontibacter sp. E15-1]
MTLENEIGISSFRNERQRASISILYTYGFLSNGYENYFKKFGLTTQQYNALRILREQHPKPVSTSFLREKMLDKMSDASRLVSRLAGKGFVVVNQNPVDKRLVNIVISDEAQKLLAEIDTHMHELDAMLQDLSEEEALQLVDLLHKVRLSVQNRVDQPVSSSEDI